MSEGLTKSAARNIFYGGSLFFLAIFGGLTAHSHLYVLNTSTTQVTDAVARGKHVWEKHSCINCHTLMGEGAYFAPELANVLIRWGGDKDMAGAKETLNAWMAAQPTGIEGRRQMPQFNLSKQELDDLGAFFEWVTKVKTQNWPPNKAG
jgi:nitric oxide reductase subunit C